MRPLRLLVVSLLLGGCSAAQPTISLDRSPDPSRAADVVSVSPAPTRRPVATSEPSPVGPDPSTPPPSPTPAPAPAPTPTGPATACVVTNRSNDAIYDDLNAAILSAVAGSTLAVQGTCGAEGSVGSRNAAFVIDRSLTIEGVRTTTSGDPTLDGASRAAVVFVEPNHTVSFVGLTITNGYTENGNGGGLFNDGSVVTLQDTIVSNNRAWVAGGIQNNFRGVMVLRNTTVIGNWAHAGGGGLYNAGEMTITGSTIRNNVSEANAGGGIFNFAHASYPRSGTLTIVDSTIEGNRAAQSGGGIFNAGNAYGVAYISIAGATILNNEAGGNGGGVLNAGQLEFLGPTTIGGNVAAGGGGLWVSSGLAVGSCPMSLGGMVTYEPRNTPTDYDGVGCVDQENTVVNHSVELSTASRYAAQTFTARTSGTLTSVALRLEHTGLNTQTAVVQVESVEAGLPTGVVLAKAAPIVVASVEWLTFGFPSPADVVSGTEYAIVLVAPTPPWQLSDLDPYPSGHAVVNGNIQAAEDFAFRTWVAP